MCEEYNGWENRTTWSVSLWLNNEYGVYSHFTAMAEELVGEAEDNGAQYWTAEEYTRFTLADRIKEYVEENNPLVDDASMYSDILGWALAGCDWQAVAAGFLEE